MRAFSLWNVSAADLVRCFRELRPFIVACRFAICIYSHEPGCAIKAAVEDGPITARRYQSYLWRKG
jgi:ribosome biogenesis GTPase